MVMHPKDLRSEKKKASDRRPHKKGQEIYQRIRLVLKGTHAEIAEAISPYIEGLEGQLDQRIISNWSTGRSTPTIEQLSAVAHVAGVKVDWLVLGDRSVSEDALHEDMLLAQEELDAARAKLAAIQSYIDGVVRQAGAASALLADATADLMRASSGNHQAHP